MRHALLKQAWRFIMQLIVFLFEVFQNLVNLYLLQVFWLLQSTYCKLKIKFIVPLIL